MHLRHRGFNFIEVMFAVILLGLGFIMIAGIFPVALQQTNATANETSGALVCRDALRNIQAIAETDSPGTTLFPAAATVTPFNGNLLNAIGTNCYFTSDRRFGWVGFYRRTNLSNSTGDPYAQVWVIALQNPNFADASYAAYGQPIPVPAAPTTPATPIVGFTVGPPFNEPGPVSPSPIVAEFAYSSITGSSYAFLTVLNPPGQPFTNPVPSAVSGAYVLVTQDPTGNSGGNPGATPPVPARPADALTGRLLRLGDPVSSLPADVIAPGTANPTNNNPWFWFELQPGSDLKDLSEETVAASNGAGTPQYPPVYIIGRAPDAAGNFTGANQDIAAMSAFVRINTSN